MEQPTLSFSACMVTETKKPLTIMILLQEGTDPNAVHSMQRFISGGVWDDKDILKRHCQEVDKYLGDKDGVQILDGSDFPKQKGTLCYIASCICRKNGSKMMPTQSGVRNVVFPRADTPLETLVRLSGMR